MPYFCHLLVPMSFCWIVALIVVRLAIFVNQSVPMSHVNLFAPSLQSTALRVCPSICLCVCVFFCVSVNACVTVKLCSMSVYIYYYVDHCVEGRERFSLGKSVWFAACFTGMAVTAIANSHVNLTCDVNLLPLKTLYHLRLCSDLHTITHTFWASWWQHLYLVNEQS